MCTCSTLRGIGLQTPSEAGVPEGCEPLSWGNQPGSSGRAAATLHYCILSPVPLPHGPALGNTGEAEQGAARL